MERVDDWSSLGLSNLFDSFLIDWVMFKMFIYIIINLFVSCFKELHPKFSSSWSQKPRGIAGKTSSAAALDDFVISKAVGSLTDS